MEAKKSVGSCGCRQCHRQREGLPSVGLLTLLERLRIPGCGICILFSETCGLWLGNTEAKSRFIRWKHRRKGSVDMNGLVPLRIASTHKLGWNMCACMILEPTSPVSALKIFSEWLGWLFLRPIIWKETWEVEDYFFPIYKLVFLVQGFQSLRCKPQTIHFIIQEIEQAGWPQTFQLWQDLTLCHSR